MAGRATWNVTVWRHRALLLLLPAAAACSCGGDEPTAPGPAVASVPPAPAPSPPPATPRPSGLQPAAQPVMSAPVPVGFERELPPPGDTTPEQPWVHLRGRARFDDVLEFYTRYLDPGTPAPVGEAASGGETRPAPECRAHAVGPKPGCPAGFVCPVEKTCILRRGGAVTFVAQRPRPPGETGALVNVTLTTVGGETRITVENESLMRILRENAPEQEFPPQPDLTQYRTLEEIPSEFID